MDQFHSFEDKLKLNFGSVEDDQEHYQETLRWIAKALETLNERIEESKAKTETGKRRVS